MQGESTRANLNWASSNDQGTRTIGSDPTGNLISAGIETNSKLQLGHFGASGIDSAGDVSSDNALQSGHSTAMGRDSDGAQFVHWANPQQQSCEPTS